MIREARVAIAVIPLAIVSALASAAPAPQPIESFARMPQMRDVVISPDGSYVAFISAVDDASVVMTFDVSSNGEYKRIAASDPGRFDLERCQWANNDRLICGLIGNIRGRKYAEAPFTRTMAVDAGGLNIKTLDVQSEKGNLFLGKTTPENLHASMPMRGGVGATEHQPPDYSQRTYGARNGQSIESFTGQRRDQIVDMTPEDHDNVLIQADENGNTYPAIFTLNVYNGSRGMRIRQNPPIRQYLSDGKGNIRVGWGGNGRSAVRYFARVEGQSSWAELEKLDQFAVGKRLVPVAAVPGRDIAYAVGLHEGRVAMWAVDLTDRQDPQIVFEHPKVDIGEPLFTNDRRMFAIRYDLERPVIRYNDAELSGDVDKINAKFLNRFNEVVDMTADAKTLVVRAFNDADAGTYYLYNRDEKKMQRLGSAYPELRPEGLGTMKPITYKARDGTDIPGYLTIPNGMKAEKLPLIVLPHDGPSDRDTWGFSFLRAFLANRGYAVLQMNYRGSAGYGEKWRSDAHQDWGGLTYSDITDATRWAIDQGIADPKRICIAGMGFGGYAAMLGAERNGDLYKCAISIAGIADQQQMIDNAALLGDVSEIHWQEEIGTNKEKLQRDSPLQHVESVSCPVLLIHGDLDWMVQVDQTKDLASELKKHKKNFKAVYIKGAGHAFDSKSDRMQLLKEVEDFLRQNLGTGA